MKILHTCILLCLIVNFICLLFIVNELKMCQTKLNHIELYNQNMENYLVNQFYKKNVFEELKDKKN